MRVLFLTRYDWAGASSRYRSYQYYPGLRKAGIDVVESPLFDRRYIDDLYAGRPRSVLHTALSLAARLKTLATASRYDLLWIEKEVLPWMPDLVEWLLTSFDIPYVVDYDDPTFHSYDLHRSAVVRGVLGRKIDRVMANARVVIAGNRYLADRAIVAGARDVEILPTVIDLERYPLGSRAHNPELILGWIGSPTNQVHVELLASVLAEFRREVPSRLRAIGFARGATLPGVDLDVVPWSEESEVREMRGFDLGIMPLRDDPWSQGKCGFKIIQYMGCALPVVASAVGANLDIVVHGETGFLARTNAEWLDALRTLAGDANLRRKMGDNGRARLESKYSLQATLPQLETILRRASETTRSHGTSP